MASKNDDIEIKVKVDTSDVDKEMKKVTKSANNMARDVEKAGDKVEDSFGDLERQLKDVSKEMGNVTKNFNMSGIINSVSKVMKNVNNTVAKGVNTVKKQLQSAFNIKGNVEVNLTTDGAIDTGGISNATALMGQAMTSGAMGAGLQESLAQIGDGVEDAMDGVGDVITDAMGGIVRSLDGSTDAIKSILNDVKGSFKPMNEEIAQGMKETDTLITEYVEIQNEALAEEARVLNELNENAEETIEIISSTGDGYEETARLANHYSKEIENLTDKVGALNDGLEYKEGTSKLRRDIFDLATAISGFLPQASEYQKALNEIMKLTKGRGANAQLDTESYERLLELLPLVNKGVKELGLNAERLDFVNNFDLSHIDTSNLEQVSNVMKEVREEAERLGLSTDIVDEKIEQINNACNSQAMGNYANNSSKLNSSMGKIHKSASNLYGSLKQLVSGFKSVDKEQNNVAKSVKKTEGAFKSLAKSLAPYIGLAAIFGGLKKSITSYTDSLQDSSKFGLVFGDEAQNMTEWLNELNSTVTTSKSTLMDFSSNLYRMGINMGASTQDSIDMSKAMTELGADLQAFTGDANSIEALAGALRGEYDSLQNFGYALSADAVEAEALALGLNTASESALLFARQSLILKQSGDILGYGALQAQTLGGQLQMLQKNFSALGSAIGACFAGLLQVVLPVLNSIVVAVTNAFNKIASVINSIFGLFGIKVGGGSVGGGGSIGGGGVGGILSDVADSAGSIGGALGDGLDSASGGAGAVADKLASGAESAKQMQKYLMGIDQINNIETDKDSGSSSPSGGGSGGSSSPSGGGGGGGLGSGGGLGNMFDSLGDSAEDASNKAKNELGEIADWIKDVANALKAIWGQLKAGWLSVADYIRQSIANLKQAFINLGSSIKDFLIGAWNNGGDKLIYNFGRLAGAITGAVIDIFGQVVQAVANLFAYLNPDNNPYTRAFITGLNNLLVACQNFALSVGGWFRTFLDNGGQAFLNVMGDIFMILGAIFTQLLADAINAVTAFMNSWLGYTVISTVAIALDVIAGTIKALLLVIQKLLPLLEALAIAFAVLALAKIASDFTATWVAINSGLVPLASMTTLGGRLANQLGVLLANVTLTRASIVAFTKDLAKFAVQGLKNALKFCGDLAKGVLQLIGHMAKLIAQFAISTATKIINFFKHPIATIKSLGTAILTCAQNVVKFGASLLTNAVKGLVGLATQCYAGIASLLGLSVAEGTATAGAVALQLALDALGIGLIIAAIVGLVAVFKNWDKITAKVKETWERFMNFLQEKCPWLYNIFKAIGDVFSWVGEKVGWLWDKIKGFFGWESDNKIEEEVNATDESLNGLGDTIEQTSERFGTACSAINESLSSIGIDSNKLALQLDQAEAMFNEKFNMISGNAREYLQAVTEGNEDMLSQMSGDADKYTAEIKSAFEDMSVAEQAVFYATYGEIQGVTDGWLDYTKGSYEECLIKHSAMLEQINNNENLTYDEKQRRIQEETEAFNTAQNEKLKQLNLTIAEMENAEWQSEEDKYQALQGYYEQRNQLVQDMENYQIGSIDTVDEAVKQSTQAQEDAYSETANAQQDALKDVDDALEDTKGSLSDFKKESDKVAQEIPKEWKGIGDTISKEFEDALKGIKTNFNGILSNTKNQCQQLKSGLQLTFSDMKIGVKKSMVEINSTITTQFTKAVNQVKTVANGFKTTLQNIFKGISTGITQSLNTIKNSMTTSFKQIVTSITSSLNSCKSKVTSTLTSINSDVKTKTSTIQTTVKNQLKNISSSFTKPFTDARTSLGSSLTAINTVLASKLRVIVSTLQSYASQMKRTMNFNFPTPYLKMPHISVHGNWDFEKKTTPSFSVRWYSQGGIFPSRTLIGVGDANNGKGNNAEAVLPLDSLWKELNVQFQKQNQALKNNNQPIQVNLYLDGKVVTSTVIDNMKDQSKRGVLDTSWL